MPKPVVDCGCEPSCQKSGKILYPFRQCREAAKMNSALGLHAQQFCIDSRSEKIPQRLTLKFLYAVYLFRVKVGGVFCKITGKDLLRNICIFRMGRGVCTIMRRPATTPAARAGTARKRAAHARAAITVTSCAWPGHR
jgi:hypothetical protein